eukprot:436877-Amphidinium_carterae.1
MENQWILFLFVVASGDHHPPIIKSAGGSESSCSGICGPEALAHSEKFTATHKVVPWASRVPHQVGWAACVFHGMQSLVQGGINQNA